jgi:hypothetical protein
MDDGGTEHARLRAGRFTTLVLRLAAAVVVGFLSVGCLAVSPVSAAVTSSTCDVTVTGTDEFHAVEFAGSCYNADSATIFSLNIADQSGGASTAYVEPNQTPQAVYGGGTYVAGNSSWSVSGNTVTFDVIVLGCSYPGDGSKFWSCNGGGAAASPIACPSSGMCASDNGTDGTVVGSFNYVAGEADAANDAVTQVASGLSALEPGIIPSLAALIGLLVVWWAVTWVLRLIHGRER